MSQTGTPKIARGTPYHTEIDSAEREAATRESCLERREREERETVLSLESCLERGPSSECIAIATFKCIAIEIYNMCNSDACAIAMQGAYAP